jgi:3-hydroxyisobutyrate dehydrogenase
MTSIALLGTGTMGEGMAASIRRAGLDLTVWNRDRSKAEPLTEVGATVADSPHDAVRGADVVVTMLFDADAVVEVMGPVLADVRGVWLQTTTVGVEGTRRLAAMAEEHGVTYADAPVLGSKQPAQQGNLQLFWAGPAHAKEKAQPVLDAIAGTVLDLADHPGPASALKLAVNAYLATMTAATGQSVAMCRALGLDPALFLQALDGSPVGSPYTQLKGKAMVDGAYREASFSVDNLRKDIGLIREAMAAAGVDTGVINAVAQVDDDTSARGLGKADIAAVVEAF